MNHYSEHLGKLRRGYPATARAASAACVLAVGMLVAATSFGSNGGLYGSLPEAAVRLLEAEPLATPSVGPNGRYLLLARRHGLLERRRLAAPAVSIAGRRINLETHGPHAPLSYYAITVVDLAGGGRRRISLPPGVTVGFPFWAPDGSRFAFTLTRPGGIELWLGSPRDGSAHRLTDDVNAVFSRPCVWLPDGRHVLCRRIAGKGATSSGALRHGQEFSPLGAESWRGFLEAGNPGAGGIRELVESRLQVIDVDTGTQRDVGGSAPITSMDPAPGGEFVIVERLGHHDEHTGGIDRDDAFAEVRDRSGAVAATLPGSKRALQWRADRPATLAWVEPGENGDRVMLQSAPFVEPARELLALEHDFAGLQWLDGVDSALVSEYLPQRRATRRWLVDAGPRRAPPRRLDSHPVDTGDGGLVLTRPNHRGRSVVPVHDGGFYLHGRALTDDGRGAVYIDHVDLDTGSRSRVWTHGGGRAGIVDTLSNDARRLLIRHENSDTPPNFHLVDRATGRSTALTDNTHPAPALRRVEQMPLAYSRSDGVPLSAVLYVPGGNEPRAPLPLIVWAYPKEVGGATVAPASPSTERYMGAERALKLFFLLCGYAVMDNVSMPVVGGGGNGNDSFVEQVVANARAAVDAAANTGLIDPARIAVAGHSYGAFMVGNLLAHSRLFRAGAALSGAYNRTLTPFGFQTEHRTLWEAREAYLAMSPLLYSDRIEAPLLLVHGTADDNAGTAPMQSLQFYRAIRGNGGVTRLLLLPGEGHTYRARESVLETTSTMLDWFDRHLKGAPAQGLATQASAALPE